MIVIDTNVFAYALLGEPTKRTEATAVLEAAGAIAAPDSVFAELANVAWQWVAHGKADLDQAVDVLRDAEALIDLVVPSAALSVRALELAVQKNHAAYDTIFVALAERQGVPLVTYDAKLRRAFDPMSITAKAFLETIQS